jgi:hypothetical protein
MDCQQSGVVIVLSTVFCISLKACGSSKRIDNHTAHMPIGGIGGVIIDRHSRIDPSAASRWLVYWQNTSVSMHKHLLVLVLLLRCAILPGTLTDLLQGGHSDFLGCADVSCQLSGSTSSSSGTLTAHVVS